MNMKKQHEPYEQRNVHHTVLFSVFIFDLSEKSSKWKAKSILILVVARLGALAL